MSVVTGRLIKGLHIGGLQLDLLAAGLDGEVLDDQPLYRRLYQRLRAAIEDGVLPAGTRLPSTRTLARDLKLSRNTIAAAFDQLHADGFLRQRVGDGTYVAPLPAAYRQQVTGACAANAKRAQPAAGRLGGSDMTGVDAAAEGNEPLSPSSALPTYSARGAAFDSAAQVAAEMEPVCMLARPGVDLFPRGQWRQVMMEVIGSRRVDGFDVCDPAGHPDLRQAVARHLSVSRGLLCDASQVIITTSGLQSVDLAVRVISDPGDRVWMEDPGCTETRATMTSAGLDIVPVPGDDAGIDVDYGRRHAADAKLVYVTPAHQFPTGRTMSLARRRALADWADRADAWVIEDEYDGDVLDPGTRLPSLQRLRHGRRTIHVGHFGLSLFASVGVGYLVVPAGSAQRFAQAKRMIDGPASGLNQLAVARFIDCGYFDAHLRRMRACYAERRVALLNALNQAIPALRPLNAIETGLHLTLRLTAQDGAPVADDRLLMRAAATIGHQIPAVSAYTVKHRSLQGLVLGYAGIPVSHASRVAAQLAEAFRAAGGERKRA
jgi:GntR family transcriptional regulator/MocR family aminotransferase